jgi:hypothetical protein
LPKRNEPCRPIVLAIVWLSIILGVAFPPLWLIPIGIAIGLLARRRNRKVARRRQIEDDAAYGRRMRGY